jgi:tetratricopeptide (TPR) repeat protein
MNFVSVQNDIPAARRAFKRALDLDPEFTAARLQYTLAIVIEILNGYANDETLLYEAENELHIAQRALPNTDGLLLAAQTGVYLAQGRLDLVPSAKVEQHWQQGSKQRNPVWVVILRLLRDETEESIGILRPWIERDPLGNPPRMLLGEALRTRGDVAEAIKSLERALQQAPRNITAAWFLTMAYLDAARPEQARTLLEGMRSGFENNYMWRFAWAMLLAGEGKRQAALEAMDGATLKFAKLTWAVTSATADFYALVGDHSKAIEWLQLAIARGDERTSYFRRNSRIAVLRQDHRFQAMLNSVEARRRQK